MTSNHGCQGDYGNGPDDEVPGTGFEAVVPNPKSFRNPLPWKPLALCRQLLRKLPVGFGSHRKPIRRLCRTLPISDRLNWLDRPQAGIFC